MTVYAIIIDADCYSCNSPTVEKLFQHESDAREYVANQNKAAGFEVYTIKEYEVVE